MMVSITIMAAFGMVGTVAYHWQKTLPTVPKEAILMFGNVFVTPRVKDTGKQTSGNVKLIGKP